MKTTRACDGWKHWARGGREYRGSVAVDGVPRPDNKKAEWTLPEQLLNALHRTASQFATQYPHGHRDVRNRPLKAFVPVTDKQGDLGCLYLTASLDGLSVKPAGRGAKEIVKFDTGSMMRLLHELRGQIRRIPSLKDVHETLADMVRHIASVVDTMRRPSLTSQLL